MRQENTKYQISPHRIALGRANIRVGLLIALLAMLALTSASCAQSSDPKTTPTCLDSYTLPQSYPSDLPISCAVTFASTVTYPQALQLVTDLGLQPMFRCFPGVYVQVNGQPVEGSTIWLPAGQQDIFQQWHILVVLPTELAPYAMPDWLAQLRKTPSVVALRPAGYDDTGKTSTVPRLRFTSDGVVYYSCPPGIPTTKATPATPILADGDDAGIYMRLTFSSAIAYDYALAAITNLGLRLADPCFETASINPNATNLPPDHPGQEIGFADTHSLLIATTNVSSTTWRQQVAGTSGVVVATSASGSSCAS